VFETKPRREIRDVLILVAHQTTAFLPEIIFVQPDPVMLALRSGRGRRSGSSGGGSSGGGSSGSSRSRRKRGRSSRGRITLAFLFTVTYYRFWRGVTASAHILPIRSIWYPKAVYHHLWLRC